MGNVTAILNEKGGVGKTTTATTLAERLAKRGKKVALVDFDGQGHSSFTLGVKNVNTLEITINTIMNRIIEEKELPCQGEYMIKAECGVDLIPSNSQLYSLERNLCCVDFREGILSQFIETIKEQYDNIIIDCMPLVGSGMVNVMMCADQIVIPSQAELASTQGLAELLKHYRIIKQRSNHNLTIAGILITMDSGHTNLSKGIKALLDTGFSGVVPMFDTHIPRSIKVAEAFDRQMTICQYMPANPAAVAYDEFVEEFLQKTEHGGKGMSSVG